MKLRFGLLCLLLALCISSNLQAQTQLRLATTTSTYNSGLLDYLLPHFEQASGIQVQVISVGTGAALRLGQDGDVDLVMTHAPEAETEFVAAGYGIEPRALMYNDFVIVGPAQDPAGIAQKQTAVDAFARIVLQGAIFVSRGDDSGTHIKELSYWQALEQTLPFPGYRAVGQGMGRVLSIADEMQGYTLTDRGTWLAMRAKLDNQLLLQGDPSLFNSYQVILVNPERHPHVQVDEARRFSDWLVSETGQALINAFQVDGEPLFFASAQEN
ncbi:substrate-binding domain-containing protein [Nitrincola tapanii]|uniref:Tungsten ABC transporter substrate-binding protein n=1 Tax=Nitrincola tapanii TaxID=1708751 RepID=A0A5A9W309_9GAMM|nr:substrate-binding domain-containing protein [Nitrincola tapanii]KAA0875077.1 tungsten ABC transporter substrate-binding protein [Nitrincola tapanii]